MEIKTINALMKYMRNCKNISINGHKDKINLYNYGYYHSYKGYRFFNTPSKQLGITEFDEITTIYNFDNSLKALLYKYVIEIETISKNRVNQIVVEKFKTNNFEEIINSSLKLNNSKDRAKNAIDLNNKVYGNLARGYKDKNNNIVNHFYSKGEFVPIWAIFELIDLGVFGSFIKCLDPPTRIEISKDMGIDNSYDTDGQLPAKMIYLIKPLRNAIAHNSVIYDVRFQDHQIDKTLIGFLEYKTGINDINFETITDYIVFISFLLKSYEISKRDILKFINDYIALIESFRKSISYIIFSEVVRTDFKNKMSKLKEYIKR